MRFAKLRRSIFVKWCKFWLSRKYERRAVRERNRIVKQAIHYNLMVTAGTINGRYRSVVLAGRRY